MDLLDPDFPPLIRGFAVDAGEDPVHIALDKAESGALGAGDLLWSRSTENAALAIILEPEVSAEHALCMVPLAMVALADSLGAIGPPNMPITFDWPKTILANGAVVGSVDMHFSPLAGRRDIAPYAVLSLTLDIMWNADPTDSKRQPAIEPGQNLMRTVLHEEGAGDLDRTMIIESWARHFTTWVDTWEQDGFKPVHENWLFKAHYRNEQVIIPTARADETGFLLGMDENGGLLVKQDTSMRIFSLGDIWFGPLSKEDMQ